jgi:polyhydroxyalkanoate synthesis regulator phasin
MEFTMSEDPAGNPKPFDPLEPFRGMRDAYLDAMAKAMVEAVNTEGYAQATGAMLDNSLTISAPFREAMEKSMLQVLQQLSLPSRQDIVALAERFTNLEMRLDDMDAKLDRMEKASHSAKSFSDAKAINKKLEADSMKPKVSKVPKAAKRAAKAQQAPSRSARKGTR